MGATLEAFRPALEGKSVAIDFRAGAGADVSLDADALEQILNNLFSNVEKYAAAGGRLEVATWQEGDFSHIVVRDHGPGIPKRERERIFQPFYRIGAKLNEGVTGTGIGLTIARELARLHGGDLTLVAGGKGACFQVTLHTSARC
ncbi:MAG: HAMP domain-containing sensor histidine kinase [Gammaproteobacteria bacterium]